MGVSVSPNHRSPTPPQHRTKPPFSTVREGEASAPEHGRCSARLEVLLAETQDLQLFSELCLCGVVPFHLIRTTRPETFLVACPPIFKWGQAKNLFYFSPSQLFFGVQTTLER